MKTLIENKKLSFDYFIESTLVAGIVLYGWEVKSFRASSYSSTNGSYVKIIGNELVITGLSITPIDKHKVSESEKSRDRRLLVTKKQLRGLIGKLTVPGSTLGVSKIFINDSGLIKVEVGICKGKRQFDKRNAIKQREVAREAQRQLSENTKMT